MRPCCRRIATLITRPRYVGLALALVWGTGCNPPPRPLLSEIGVTDSSKVADKELPVSTDAVRPIDSVVPIRTLELPWESWHTYFVGGKKVGYLQVKSELDPESSDERVRTILTEYMMVSQGTSRVVQKLQQVNVETRDGTLLSFDSELQIGPTLIKSNGRVSLDTLIVNASRGNQQSTNSWPWGERVGGPAAIQQALMAKPMEVGEERRVRMLLPIQHRMAVAELKCVHQAPIATSVGKLNDTFEIDVQIGSEDGPIVPSTLWIDEKGKLIKSYSPSTDLIAVRSTQEDVEKVWNAVGGNSVVASIRVKGMLSNPLEAFRAGYLLKPKANVPTDSFGIPPQIGQYFRKREDGAIQLLVSRDPTESNRADFTGLVSDSEAEDLTSNLLVDSGSPDVRELANLSRSTDPRMLAYDLARTAKQLIISTEESPELMPASETARASGGSVGSRAVLLAAMLRAREIPSRVVAGLVYRESDSGAEMVYHVWTLAWIDGRWLALDASTGGLAAADRIALATSSLAKADQYDLLAPVVAAVSQFEIEIGNAKYQPLE